MMSLQYFACYISIGFKFTNIVYIYYIYIS